MVKSRKLIRTKLTNFLKELYVQCHKDSRYLTSPKWVYADFELEADDKIEELTTISVEGEKKR